MAAALWRDREPTTLRGGLVVRHHVEDDAGLIGEAFAARGFALDTFLLDHDHPSPDLGDAEILIVLGSNTSTYHVETRGWFERELDLMREADRRGVAILGICFGAQALCEMSGGTVERAPTGEVGWYPIDVEPWSDLPHGPWFEYHFDHCVLPPSAKVWARNENAVQAFHVGRHLGVQFHPEVDADQLERWFASPGSDPRAHADREAELLARTREETPAARHRAGILVDLFLTHAALVEAPR